MLHPKQSVETNVNQGLITGSRVVTLSPLSENILLLPLDLLCEMTEFFLARMSLPVNPSPSIVAIIFLMNLL